MRPISRTQHGVLDYLTVALLLALPRVLPVRARARRLLRLSAAAGGALAPATRYELGPLGLVPMRVHLAIDGVFAAVWLAGAAAFTDEEPAVRSALAGLAATGALAALLTDPDRA